MDVPLPLPPLYRVGWTFSTAALFERTIVIRERGEGWHLRGVDRGTGPACVDERGVRQAMPEQQEDRPELGESLNLFHLRRNNVATKPVHNNNNIPRGEQG